MNGNLLGFNLKQSDLKSVENYGHRMKNGLGLFFLTHPVYTRHERRLQECATPPGESVATFLEIPKNILNHLF